MKDNILFLPLKIFLITLDFMIMLLTFGWINAIKKLLTKEPLRSVPVGDDDDPSHRVHAKHKDNIIQTPFNDVTTIYELARRSFNLYSTQNCMASREYLGMYKPPKIKHFGDVKYKTYGEVGTLSTKFGYALRSVGLVPAPPTTSLDKLSTPCSLAIFENTCEEWMIAALGCYTQSIIITTIYSTLGMDAVVDAINDGVISAILCNKRNVNTLIGRCEEMPTLKTIIYTNDCIGPNDKVNVPEETEDSLKIVSFDDFITNMGNITTSEYKETPPTPDTTAIIMYTSGSTGKPKGVIATHGNILASVASGNETLGIKEGKDVYLGYLPLAHILELMAEVAMIGGGCTICYADPRSLTTTGAYPIGALEQYKPTVMAGVPKIWDLIKKGVQAKVSQSSPIAQFLVETAFEARSFAIEHGYDTPLFKLLVFKKFSKVVGGKLRQALSGGGPLNSEVQIFVRTCFGCPLFQGYGLTETTAGLSIQDPLDLRCGIAGVPIPSCEVKLDSTPDITDKAGLPYLKTDTKDVDGNDIFGRGEILVKGYNVAFGYYMMPDKTKEEFGSGPDGDGFFKTGDIGQFLSDGSLRIVDRKKNLVKLKGGEYIAVEKMEMAYGNSSFVDAAAGGICCYGDGDMDRPVALLQLNIVTAKQYLKDFHNITGDFEMNKTSKVLYDAIMDDMKKEGKKAGLSHIEFLAGVALLTEHWTPENGCLTAANKLQRRAVIQMFETEFNVVKEKGIFK